MKKTGTQKEELITKIFWLIKNCAHLLMIDSLRYVERVKKHEKSFLLSDLCNFDHRIRFFKQNK